MRVERRIVPRPVEVRTDEFVAIEAVEVMADLIAVARLDEQERVLDEEVELSSTAVPSLSLGSGTPPDDGAGVVVVIAVPRWLVATTRRAGGQVVNGDQEARLFDGETTLLPQRR